MALPPIPVHEPKFFQNLKLPPLPKTIAEVYQAIQAGQGPQQITPLISQDVAFAAHLLRVINSPYYSLPAPVSNVRMAVAYLGLAEIARMALALSVVQTLAPPDPASLREFWLHAYHTALISKHLARRLRPRVTEVDDLYAAALLHDLGQLVYARCFPEHARVVREEMARDHLSRVEVERRHDLPTSGRLGAMVADHWRLSEIIKQACTYSDRSLSDLEPWPNADPTELLVLVSHQLAAVANDGHHHQGPEALAEDVARVLGESAGDFLLVMADVYELKLKAEAAVSAML